ncbi:hypothetical protein T440DRAFT_401513 [Plenodomus tracheiphilus IPT5]|uniref:Rhodopsin domain-containing protein n=1 Tax=Plenodomus tracheiphilus IPT5 TaxID=1408161 RepID=A0A6A7B233_9PLEO|nr:hypothetical protein T440DRAFT_401513 [Plenodomus tracheiphilus IPT5]
MGMPFNQESWIWYTCAVMMIGARLISRKILFRSWKGLQIDDWIMGLIITFCYTLLLVLSNRWLKVQSNLEPATFDFSTLTTEELTRRRYGSKLVIVLEQSQILSIWLCKACLLIMYHRLTRTAQRNENIAIKLLSIYVAIGFVVIELLYFTAWCRPFHDYYAVPTRSQCNTMVHHRIVKAVFNISSDIIMLCIALQMLIRSLLPMKRKIILCGIFSLGIFVIAASILNIYYSLKNPYKATWIYWYVRESSTAILVANLPFTWTILRECFEVGAFDETNPLPWTYHMHASRPANYVPHHMSTTAAQAGTYRSPNNSYGDKRTQSIELGGRSSITKRNSDFLTRAAIVNEDENDLHEQAIRLHDFASTLSPPFSTVDIDLEHGVIEPAHLRPPPPTSSAATG